MAIAATAPDDRREIRLALVLNGGVSLAIWIGGVVAEIDRARRSALSEEHDDELVTAYRSLLDLTETVLRTDVIAGASAGGLNGCLLAAAIANGGTVADVRDLWIGLGSFRQLLRSGLDPAPKSVLQGDDYFLPRLREEFERRCRPADVRRALAEPKERALRAPRERVRLFVTGTDLAGERVTHVDDFGSTLDDYEHRALFLVEHDPATGVSTFADDDVAAKLARIARTTASFPGAFEASFCRVDADDAAAPAAGAAEDPDLSREATFTRNRWVIDGGVLDNAPFRPALAAMRRSPGAAPVRRVLCYITPYGAGTPPGAADREAEPPMRTVVGAAFNLPRDVTGTETLEDVEDYRRRVQRRRAGRAALAARLAELLAAQAVALMPLYLHQRALASVDDALDDIGGGPRARFLREAARSTSRPRRRTEQLLARGVVLPWVPEEERADGVHGDQRQYVDELLSRDAAGWSWGLAPIERSALVVGDLLSRTLEITPAPQTAAEAELRRRVYDARRRLSAVLVWAGGLGDAVVAGARAAHRPDPRPGDAVLVELNGGAALSLDGVPPDEREQLAQLLRMCAEHRARVGAAECRERMGTVVDCLGDAGRAALELLSGVDRAELAPTLRGGLVQELLALVQGAEADDSAAALHARLLRLEVVHEAIAPSGGEQQQGVDLIRINAEAECALDRRPDPADKLTGLKLAHFGAFYKRSWRANDWLWGRLDGASRLVDVLLEPWQLRLCLAGGRSPEALTAALVALARPDGGDGAFLANRFAQRHQRPLETGIREEVDALAAWPLEGEPPRLDRTGDAIRARLQLAIAREELPAVRIAARADAESEGAAPDAAGAGWARSYATLDTPEQVEAALKALRLSQEEQLGGEIGSDLLTRNAATTAVVAASTLAATRSGLPGVVRLVPRALRGLLLALYGLTWGLTSQRRALKVLAVLVLLAAILLVVWGLLADVNARELTDAPGEPADVEAGGPPAWLEAPAKLAVAGGFVLAPLRFGTLGVVVALAAAVGYLALVLTPFPDGAVEVLLRIWATSVLATLAILLVAGGLAVAALFDPVGRFFGWLRRRRRRIVSG
ncbi:MAG TPA: patatin-like protein [Gaiellaceae bacterium]|nr:patatin-like protein [Gaiellaceae bacterium]